MDDNFLAFTILDESDSEDILYCKLCGEIFESKSLLFEHCCPRLKAKLKKEIKAKESPKSSKKRSKKKSDKKSIENNFKHQESLQEECLVQKQAIINKHQESLQEECFVQKQANICALKQKKLGKKVQDQQDAYTGRKKKSDKTIGHNRVRTRRFNSEKKLGKGRSLSRVLPDIYDVTGNESDEHESQNCVQPRKCNAERKKSDINDSYSRVPTKTFEAVEERSGNEEIFVQTGTCVATEKRSDTEVSPVQKQSEIHKGTSKDLNNEESMFLYEPETCNELEKKFDEETDQCFNEELQLRVDEEETIGNTMTEEEEEVTGNALIVTELTGNRLMETEVTGSTLMETEEITGNKLVGAEVTGNTQTDKCSSLTQANSDIVKSVLTEERITDQVRSKSKITSKSDAKRRHFLPKFGKLCESCGYHVPEEHLCTVQVNIPDDDAKFVNLNAKTNQLKAKRDLSSFEPAEEKPKGYYVVERSLKSKAFIPLDTEKNELHKTGNNTGTLTLEEFNCIQCGQSFFQSDMKIKDEEQIFSLEEKLFSVFRCEKCAILLSFKDKLKQGILSFNVDDFTPLISRINSELGCRICSEDLTEYNQLNRLSHLLQHAKEIQKQCVICLKPLNSVRILRSHMKKHQILINHTNFFRRVKAEINIDGMDSQEELEGPNIDFDDAMNHIFKVQSSEDTRAQNILLNTQNRENLTAHWEPQILNEHVVDFSRANEFSDSTINNISKTTKASESMISNVEKKRKLDNLMESPFNRKSRIEQSLSEGKIITETNKNNLVYMLEGEDIIRTSLTSTGKTNFNEDKNIHKVIEVNEDNLEIINSSVYIHAGDNHIGITEAGGCNLTKGDNITRTRKRKNNKKQENQQKKAKQNPSVPNNIHKNIGFHDMSIDSFSHGKGGNQATSTRSNDILGQYEMSELVQTSETNEVSGDMSRQIHNEIIPSGVTYTSNVTYVSEKYSQVDVSRQVPNSVTYVSDVSEQPINLSQTSRIGSSETYFSDVSRPQFVLSSDTCQTPSSISFDADMSSQLLNSFNTNKVPDDLDIFSDVPGQIDMSRQVVHSTEINNLPDSVAYTRETPRQLTPPSLTNTKSHGASYNGDLSYISDMSGQQQQQKCNKQVPSSESYFCDVSGQRFSEGSKVPDSMSYVGDMPGQVHLVRSSETSKVTSDLRGNFKIPDNLTEEEEIAFLARLNADGVEPFQIMLCSDEDSLDSEDEVDGSVSETEVETNMTESQKDENVEIVGNFDPEIDSGNCAFVQEIEVGSLTHNISQPRISFSVKDRDNSGDFQCDMCTLRFKKQELLDKHKDIHLKKPFVCWQCFITFSSSEPYISHMKAVHECH